MLNHFRLATAVFLAFLLVSVSGCIVPGTFSGGGTIPNGNSKNGKATFTFSGDNCDGYIVGSVNYNGHEPKPDTVMLQSTDIEETGQCVRPGEGEPSDACGLCYGLNLLSQAGDGPIYASEFTYVSKNKQRPGTGHAFICVQDNGEGVNAPRDLGVIKVTSGPYKNYIKYGPIQGNAQAGTCPD
jgi:hypothetical protein